MAYKIPSPSDAKCQRARAFYMPYSLIAYTTIYYTTTYNILLYIASVHGLWASVLDSKEFDEV